MRQVSLWKFCITSHFMLIQEAMDKMEVSEVVEVTEEVTSTQTKGTTPKKRTSTHQEVNVEKPKKPRSVMDNYCLKLKYSYYKGKIHVSCGNSRC